MNPLVTQDELDEKPIKSATLLCFIGNLKAIGKGLVALIDFITICKFSIFYSTQRLLEQNQFRMLETKLRIAMKVACSAIRGEAGLISVVLS